ncbi:uncharacterized protein LOC111254592 isoform X2 [Varroa destructor]|uniref:Uncharacterized protein n=1 Tax=Varroa destructor TaxID=109461 RepID=A0A7M7KVQ5_VARDE|nr:uncharacterized protein LOC111254592 isoform X2 [Varroa destructor]
MSAGRAVISTSRVVAVPWSRPQNSYRSGPNECRIGQPHGQPSIFLHSLSSPTITNSSSVSTSSFDTAEAEPAEALSPWRASCARVCPTVTYFIINFVWMSTGIAGIALGNFVNKRYFSILLVSVFGLMVAVIYRFLYDLEHMDTMPNQPTVVSYPPTPTSRRSLPPCYSSVVRSETPPPSYNEYLAMICAQQLSGLPGGPHIIPVPTISSLIENSRKKSPDSCNRICV